MSNGPVFLPNIRLFDQGAERRGKGHDSPEGSRGLLMVLDQGERRVYVPLNRMVVMNLVGELEAWLEGHGKFPPIEELRIPIDSHDMYESIMRETPGGVQPLLKQSQQFGLRGSANKREHSGKDSRQA